MLKVYFTLELRCDRCMLPFILHPRFQAGSSLSESLSRNYKAVANQVISMAKKKGWLVKIRGGLFFTQVVQSICHECSREIGAERRFSASNKRILLNVAPKALKRCVQGRSSK